MSAFYNFLELRDDIEELGRDAGKEAARIARNATCSLYNNTPGWLVRDNLLLGRLTRSALNSMCSNSPTGVLPPPPSGDFFGGQCPGISYKIRYDQPRLLNGDIIYDGQNFESPVVGGADDEAPFSNLRMLVDGIDTPLVDVDGTSGVVYENTKQIRLRVDTTLRNDFELFILSTVRGLNNIRFLPVSGSDYCGDDPPSYPPAPPPVANDLNTEVTINLEDNTSVDIPVTVVADNDNYLSLPLTVIVGNVTTTIGYEGVSVTNNYSTVNNFGGGGGVVTAPPPSAIDTPDPTDPDQVDTEDLPEEQSEDKTGVENLVGVKITLTVVPSDADVVSGGASKDIYYAGWFYWKTGDFAHLRQFINFDQSYYQAPVGVDGYGFRFKNGYSGFVTEVKKKEK